MSQPLSSFIDSPLPAATDDEEYDVYRAAMEWHLASPIVIRSGEDILSRDRWQDRVQPFHHQVQNLITFCRLAPAVLLADEVGLGKTISAGLILSELVARRRVTRTLVVCPDVLCDQWVRELADKFRIEAVVAKRDEFLEACAGSAAVVVTNYDAVRKYFGDDQMPTDTFQMLILDEAHRLRNLHGPNGPPLVAQAVRDALASRWFTYVLMLTATPLQNRFSDIYSLIDLLTVAKGHRNPFGNAKDFAAKYVLGKEGRQLRPNVGEQFRQILNTYVARTRRVDARLPFPTRQVNMVPVALSTDERILERLVGGVVGQMNHLAQSSLGVALMSSPAALAAQLETMAATRPALTSVAARARGVADSPILPAKLQRLCTICEELRAARSDWRVVVYTGRRETQELIRRTLKARGIPVGLIASGRAAENSRDISDFLAHSPLIHVLVSTDLGSEGINLQNANWLVNYDLPWNPMQLEQRIGRIQRLGSPHKEVIIQNLVATGTVEELVVSRLMQRLMMVTETVGDLESIIAAATGGEEDKAGERFDTRVRDLVVRSLQGQDATKAAEQLAESVELAKREYEANSGQLNRSLGALDGQGNLAPEPPKFERRPPSMPAEAFVRAAMKADGRVLREIRPGLFEESSSRSPTRRIALNPQSAEDTVNASHVERYYPGQRAFDLLVERWVARRSHRVTDLRVGTDEAAKRLAQAWCQRFSGISFLSCTIRDRKRHINGRVLIRMTAENRVDQHQKLVEQVVSPEGHNLSLSNHPAAQPYRAEVSLKDIAPKAAIRVSQSVAEDKEVNAFVRYYVARRTNELSRAGSDPHLCQRVDNDFKVDVRGEVVGFRGICYEEAILDVSFSVSGYTYAATLQAIPVAGQIIEQPSVEACPVTGLRMPFGVLGKCERSARLIPEHLLYRSVISGRQAACEYLVRCEVTAQLVMDDEVEVCEMTGRRAVSSEFSTCSLTQQRVLRSEVGTSAVSGAIVRRDLLFPSEQLPYRIGTSVEHCRCEITGRSLLIDEVGRSAVSDRAASLTLLLPSERSGRLGLEEETVRCEQTGRLLLHDEIGVCSVTQKRVDSSLLVRSDISGKQALADHSGRCVVTNQVALLDELVRCQFTGELALPDELEVCAVTGERMIRRRMVVCDSTNVWLSPRIAVTSDASGRIVRPDLIRRSDRPPHRTGLLEEIGVCEITQRNLLLDEMARSIVSGRLIDRQLLEGTEDRLAHRSEFVRCEVSGRRLLPVETGVCCVTGKHVALDRLIQSDVSGKWLLREEAVQCSVTHKLVAPGELELCETSGRRALFSEMGTCQETGVRVIKTELVQCSESGNWIARTAAGRSDYRPRWVARRLLRSSEKNPEQLGTVNEFGICSQTGKALLLDELERSAVSGKLADRDLLKRSKGCGQYALPEEMVRCEESGDDYLPTETQICAVSGKRASSGLMEVSKRSGRFCLRRLFVVCPLTGRKVPPDDIDTCAITGQRVAANALVMCAVTGKKVVPSALKMCAKSGEWVLPSELGSSDYRPRLVKKSLLRRSSKPPGRMGTEDEFGLCEISGKRLLLDELGRCNVSNRLVDRELLVTCDVTGQQIYEGESYKCAWLGKWMLKRYIEVCELTRVGFSRRCLDENHMLQPLAELLDGHLPQHAVDRNDLIPHLKRLSPKLFTEIHSVRAVESPSEEMLAVCVNVSERVLFRRKQRQVGFLLTRGENPRIVGDLVIGVREGRVWQLLRSESFK